MFDFTILNKFSNNRAIIYHETAPAVTATEKPKVFTYAQMIKESNLIKQILPVPWRPDYGRPTTTASVKRSRPTQNSTTITGILLENHHPAIVPIIIGILSKNKNDMKNAFCFIEKQSDENVHKKIQDLQLKCIITLADYELKLPTEASHEVKIFGLRLKIYILTQMVAGGGDLNSNNYYDKDIMFVASTSGSTTNKPKQIFIPYKCFLTNVNDLIGIYKVRSSDVIFTTSPPTFDPFILDIFLVISTGATLAMSSELLRFPPLDLMMKLFGNINGNDNVTIIQMTPSIFQRFFTDYNLTHIQISSLRCLSLGGEPFPQFSQTLIDWKSSDGTIKLFNIYGCTEQSCWSMIYQVLPIDLRNNSIPLGGLIHKNPSVEKIKIINSENCELFGDCLGELCFVSDLRQCYWQEENRTDLGCVFTGDIVQRIDDKIYYKYRRDDIVKRYGCKINLKSIELIAKSFGEVVLDACCLFNQPNKCLALFVTRKMNTTNGNHKKLSEFLKKNLSSKEFPDLIEIIQEFPLSKHGKISKHKLWQLRSITKHNENLLPEAKFIELLNLYVQYNKTNKKSKKTFRNLGGTSFLALTITTQMEEFLGDGNPLPNLLTMLLNDQKDVNEIIDYVKNCCKKNQKEIRIPPSPPLSTPDEQCLIPTWKIDLKKCIDSTPTICYTTDGNQLISIGGHSHHLINVQAADGKIISEIIFPDRIECQVTQLFTTTTEIPTTTAFVGCYNGHLYSFDICLGQINWQFNSGGLIKCRPLIINNNNLIIFGNYNEMGEENVWCLNNKNGKIKWKIRLGKKSINADPILFKSYGVFVCTLDGTYGLLSPTDGKIIWEKKLKSPIFSNPKLIFNSVIFAEVTGQIHCVDCHGNSLWTYTINGNIFSSFLIINNENIENCNKKTIIFGGYDKTIYCLSTTAAAMGKDATESDKFVAQLPTLLWNCYVNEQIFTTPALFKKQLIIICCINGLILTINLKNGLIVERRKVNGEIFSSPTVCNVNLSLAVGNHSDSREKIIELNKIFVGCRNNYLYCFEI